MKIITAFAFFILSISVHGFQIEKLPVEEINGKNYRIYKVQEGDGWYSIARKFEIKYTELKLANKASDKLIVGKTILIPTSKLKINDPAHDKNHLDKNNKKNEKGENKIETVKTHKVSSGQTLFSIAKQYNISVDKLKSENQMSNNTIHLGQILKIPVSKNEIAKSAPEVKNIKQEEPIPPIIIAPKEEHVPPKVQDEKIEEKPKEKVNENSTNQNLEDERKIVYANGRQEINETCVASWIDGQSTSSNKYYALHKTAPIGTIIKITNRMNSTSIYVKVVGRLPETGENEGILIKVSKAGADKLGVIDQRFQAQLVYGISSSK